MGFNEVFGFFGIFMTFCAVLFLVYVTTRYVGSKASKALKGKFISIVDTINIGLDKQLHLINVGDDYFLIASSGKNIEFLSQVNIKDADIEEVSESNAVFDFKSLFEKYVQNMKGASRKDNMESDSGAENQSNGEVFKSNLKKLKTINLRGNYQENNDGDEITNEK